MLFKIFGQLLFTGCTRFVSPDRQDTSAWPTFRHFHSSISAISTSHCDRPTTSASCFLNAPNVRDLPYRTVMLPRALLLNLIKAFAIKSIKPSSSTPPHITCPILIHTLNTTVNPVLFCKHCKCFWI